jgi:hypothetical protein
VEPAVVEPAVVEPAVVEPAVVEPADEPAADAVAEDGCALAAGWAVAAARGAALLPGPLHAQRSRPAVAARVPIRSDFIADSFHDGSSR